MKFFTDSFLAFGLAAAALRADITPVSCDFNSYANNLPGGAEGLGYWEDANGWSTTEVGGYFHVSTTGSSDGSNFIRFNDAGPGYGATASISNTFGTVATNDRFSLSFSYLTANYWGTLVGIGSAAEQGVRLTIWQYDPANIVNLGTSTPLGGSPYNFAGAAWTDFRVDIDLGANGGSGSASVFARPTGSLAWSSIPSLSSINLGLDSTRTAGDSTNPLNWNTLWFHEEGATSGVDNVAIAPIPEPSQVLVSIALMVFVLIRLRRRSS